MQHDKATRARRPLLQRMAAEARTGRLDRREFLALATTFGAAPAIAYGLLGLAAPRRAQAATPQRGGTLRISGQVLELVDPRKFSRTEQGNLGRCVCETLVRWEDEATLAPMLLSGWDVSEDARRYVLHVRPGVRWNNGDSFTADDVIHNLRRWCDREAPGNSMATRMAPLIDPETGQAHDYAIERIDDMTVALNLQRADVTLIAGMVDYPALIVHRSFSPEDSLIDKPIGTGPFELVDLQIGNFAEFRRRADGAWWAGEVPLDGVRFIDYGFDPAAVAAAFDAEEIDANDETPPDFVELMDSLGLVQESRRTANTLVARMRVDTPPYDDVRLRRALQMAISNEVVLQLGHGGYGIVGENHHVAPMHPEYVKMPPPRYDPEAARALAHEARLLKAPLELISIDGDWRATTADVVAGQLRDAGFNIRRKIIAGKLFWNRWRDYPFSTTSWGGRPMAMQVLNLAYRSDAVWNETAFADPEFDRLLDAALANPGTGERQALWGRMEAILRDAGMIIQPYWRDTFLHHTERVRNFNRERYRELHFGEVWLES